jgi:hypothetical protein
MGGGRTSSHPRYKTLVICGFYGTTEIVPRYKAIVGEERPYLSG